MKIRMQQRFFFFFILNLFSVPCEDRTQELTFRSVPITLFRSIQYVVATSNEDNSF